MSVFNNGSHKGGGVLLEDPPDRVNDPAPGPSADPWQGTFPGVSPSRKEDAHSSDRRETKGVRPMSTNVIVLVSDQEDANHWEITALESTDAAERLVERCLERGVDPHAIRVFTGAELSMKVAYKPVVAFDDALVARPEPDGDLADPQGDRRAVETTAADGYLTKGAAKMSSLFRPVGEPPPLPKAEGEAADRSEELTLA